MRMLKRLWACKNGATALEYGLIAGLISVAVIASVNSLGNDVGTSYDVLSSDVTNAIGK